LADKKEKLAEAGIVQWFRTRLARTYLVPAFLSFEAANPLSYFGMLAFICFILLGVTGVLLMVYYVPGITTSYDSVMTINDIIPYAFEMRNLHYWLANFMIVLSILHLFYLYFTRKYKLYDEVLWVTGMILGVLTVAVTYTGYVLIMNMRAMLALDIGTGILRTIDINLSFLFQGFSYTDTILRMYLLHIVLLPAVMVVLFIVHFPRKLTLDAPIILGMTGAAFVVGGLFPVALGLKFIPGQPSMIIIPEWYLTGIYALLRTGLQVFAVTVLLPFIFILVLTLVPFHDMQRGLGVTGRALHATIGVTAMAHIVLVTFWGFTAGDLIHPIITEADLAIDPIVFYAVLIITALLIFGIARLLMNRRNLSRINFKWLTSDPPKFHLKYSTAMLLIGILFAFQVLLIMYLFYLQPVGSQGLAMAESGLTILAFGAATSIYRAAS